MNARVTADSEANRQRALFFTGKTLYKMHLHVASLSYFARITGKGASHRYYNATLAWLVALSRLLPETSGVLRTIAAYDATALDEPANRPLRDELAFQMGSGMYAKGKFKAAVALLGRVSAASPFFLRAKLLKGIAHARQYDAKRSLLAFKQILRAVRRKAKSGSRSRLRRFEHLALLQIARLFYWTHQYDLAIKYYGLVPRGSAHRTDAIFEAAWAHQLNGQHALALANIYTVKAPFVAKRVHLEPTVLESYIYLQNCRYNKAQEVAKTLSPYKALRKQVRRMLDKFEDNSAFFTHIRKLSTSRHLAPAQQLFVDALRDSSLADLLRWNDVLAKEIRVVANARTAWKSTAIAATILEELTLHKSLADNDAGRALRERLHRRYRVLRERSIEALKLRIVADEERKRPATKRRRHRINAPVVISGTHPMWRVNGGFGQTAVGGYRFGLSSQCPKGRPAPVAKKPAPKSRAGGTYEFERDNIEGELITPDGTLDDMARWGRRPRAPIYIRTNFLRRILRSRYSR